MVLLYHQGKVCGMEGEEGRLKISALCTVRGSADGGTNIASCLIPQTSVVEGEIQFLKLTSGLYMGPPVIHTEKINNLGISSREQHRNPCHTQCYSM